MARTREEMETVLRYDYVDKVWIAYSCIPKHINKLEKSGWVVKERGSDYATFTAPQNAVTIRSIIKKEKNETS